MTPSIHLYQGDCLDLLPRLPKVDFVFTSPPYEDARTYGIDFHLKGRAWVEWALERYHACLHRCDGLVAWVVNGRTKQYQFSATPIYLMAMLANNPEIGFRKPAIYQRFGVPGSGGPDYLKDNYEFVICAHRRRGRLPWADPTAMGHPPKCPPGGLMSNRRKGGSRERQAYVPPKLVNPGNIVDCGAVGGGNLGSEIAHENEAPFPEKLAEFFIRTFCPPGGTVLDPFCGSGTTLKVAAAYGRNAIGIDIRRSQVAIARRRLETELPGGFDLHLHTDKANAA